MISPDLHDQPEAAVAPSPRRAVPPRRRPHNSLEIRERRKKLLRYLLGAGVVILVVNAVIGESGYFAGVRARREHDVLAARVAKVQSENQQLGDLSRRLKDDPAALEDAARRELGLVREGETLVIVRDGEACRQVTWFIDFILHLDAHLIELVSQYGSWVYAILFGIVFAETGFVVTPFLPGDSLLFATGALCATGALSTPYAAGLLAVAAFSGNAVNYAIGRSIGPRVFRSAGGSGRFERLLNREHLQRAHEFFEKYGGKAVVLGRFVPIVRTFVPFVAGAAQMSPSSFVFYNLVGAIGWVVLCLGAGVLWGNVPWVKDHFSAVTLGIVFISVLPVLVEFVRQRRRPHPN